MNVTVHDDGRNCCTFADMVCGRFYRYVYSSGGIDCSCLYMKVRDSCKKELLLIFSSSDSWPRIVSMPDFDGAHSYTPVYNTVTITFPSTEV